MAEIRNRFYRVSIKALVLNETKDKFLVTKMENGVWDLPGGGLDWEEKPHACLKREITEEMNIEVTRISDQPLYLLGGHPMSRENNSWVVNIVYETELKNLNFTPSDECVEIRFVSLKDLNDLGKVPPTVQELAEVFKPENHSNSSNII